MRTAVPTGIDIARPCEVEGGQRLAVNYCISMPGQAVAINRPFARCSLKRAVLKSFWTKCRQEVLQSYILGISK